MINFPPYFRPIELDFKVRPKCSIWTPHSRDAPTSRSPQSSSIAPMDMVANDLAILEAEAKAAASRAESARGELLLIEHSRIQRNFRENSGKGKKGKKGKRSDNRGGLGNKWCFGEFGFVAPAKVIEYQFAELLLQSPSYLLIMVSPFPPRWPRGAVQQIWTFGRSCFMRGNLIP